MHCIPLFWTSSPCDLLFLNLGLYGLVQATVGVGTVLIWDFCVTYTRGGGGYNKIEASGAQAFAGLKDATALHALALNLAVNNMGDSGAQALAGLKDAAALHTLTLKL